MDSSSQLIDQLSGQVDHFNNLNLQLTAQSQSFLDKLNQVQKKEIKLVENIELYKHQRASLESILQRKTRKLQMVEEEMESLQMTYDSLLNDNKLLHEQLYNQIDGKDAHDKKINEINEEYNQILESEVHYKEQIQEEIDTLQNKVTSTVQERNNSLQNELSQYHLLEQQLKVLNKLNNSEKQTERVANEEIDKILKQLDLESWIILYKSVEQILQEYVVDNNLINSAKVNNAKVIEERERNTKVINQIQNELTEDMLQNIQQKKRNMRNVTPNLISSPTISSPRISSASRRSTFNFNNNSSLSSSTLPGVRRQSGIINVTGNNGTIANNNNHNNKRNSMIFN